MAERLTVNQKVSGSSPDGGALMFFDIFIIEVLTKN
jgi:hypothetical protein